MTTDTQTTLAYTVHPFNDEWLWSANDEPLRVDDLDKALDLAKDERKDRAALDEAGRALAKGMWFVVRDYPEGEVAAVISPSDELIDREDPRSLASLEAIDQSGEWVEIAEQPEEGDGLDALSDGQIEVEALRDDRFTFEVFVDGGTLDPDAHTNIAKGVEALILAQEAKIDDPDALVTVGVYLRGHRGLVLGEGS